VPCAHRMGDPHSTDTLELLERPRDLRHQFRFAEDLEIDHGDEPNAAMADSLTVKQT